jgi:hypothetical protein
MWHRKGGQQGRDMVVGRKEYSAERWGKEAVDREIVPFQHVAACRRGDGPWRHARMAGSHCLSLLDCLRPAAVHCGAPGRDRIVFQVGISCVTRLNASSWPA